MTSCIGMYTFNDQTTKDMTSLINQSNNFHLCIPRYTTTIMCTNQ